MRMLRPLDIVILLKIHCKGDQPWSQMSLAKELFISSRSVNEGLKRASLARLFSHSRRQVNASGLLELLGAARWIYPARFTAEVKGMPTSWAAPPLYGKIVHHPDDLKPVWPDSEGKAAGNIEGLGMEPLHPSVPVAALEDHELYEALALVDAVRGGGARERSLAKEELCRRLRS